MIYFTFFHSLFWQNTMKERGGLPFSVFSGPKCSITQPHGCQSRRKELSLPTSSVAACFTDSGGRADSSKEGHRHHSHCRPGTAGHCPRPGVTTVSLKHASLSAARGRPRGQGVSWQEGRTVSFHFHSISYRCCFCFQLTFSFVHSIRPSVQDAFIFAGHERGLGRGGGATCRPRSQGLTAKSGPQTSRERRL